ncbi:MAG: YeaC family protein [Kangiellaceae bacterium]|nr:YeaC family protein [Kangiellaceae bacterium]MCW8998538.1 YeaC family protein [Kangiellaceae bacterium]MCW9015977.1 YeaC family protein [Kangiellaceae bacterium]
MDYSQTVANLTPEIVAKLKTAIELGKWEDGTKLTSEQVESAMQAVMLWDAKHVGNKNEEPFVIGEKGQLYTGKGESHKTATPEKVDVKSIIAKNKV